jgi:BASS family bile acid:Na+ symporter
LQALLILTAIVIGILLPQGHVLTFMIRYVLMAMLFMTFLGVTFRREVLRKDHFVVLALNVALPVLFFFLIKPINEVIALAVFVIGIAPTAAAAPVIASFFRANIESVTTSVVITSPVVALLLPLILPQIIVVEGDIAIWDVMQPILIVVFVPLLLSLWVKKQLPRTTAFLRRYGKLTFGLFLINMYIASAKATTFIRHEMTSEWWVLGGIAIAVGILCLINFTIGERIGAKALKMENGLALGRKNTMFAIWLSLTFLSPIVALGPMFYILWQNVYNSWQLYALERQ